VEIFEQKKREENKSRMKKEKLFLLKLYQEGRQVSEL